VEDRQIVGRSWGTRLGAEVEQGCDEQGQAAEGKRLRCRGGLGETLKCRDAAAMKGSSGQCVGFEHKK